MPLTALRVLELGAIPAASYCGRLFADFGADVLKIESPDGDPARGQAPLVSLHDGSQEGAYFGYLNVRKRSAVLNPECEVSCKKVLELVEQADVLIDSLTVEEKLALGLDHEQLIQANPNLVIVAVSWFGDTGPYRDYVANDAVCRALAGVSHAIGPVEGPPVPLPDYQGSIVGGVTAFMAAMAGVASSEQLGGRRFEVSVLEANLAIADYNVALSWFAGGRDQRRGVNRFLPNFPMGIYGCKSGWIGVTVVTPVQWKTFCRILGVEDLGADPAFAVNRDRLKNADTLEERFKHKFLEKTAQEWFEIALDLMLPFVVVPDMQALLVDQEHRRRGVFETLTHGAREYEAPRSPMRLSLTPPRSGGTVPRLGSAEIHWSSQRRASQLPSAKSAASPGDLPLKGVLVVDLSMGWAGPHAARHLADLGAEVIKIEACQYPDWWRGVDNRPIVFEQKLYEKSPFFMLQNRNKLGITLDLTTVDGVNIVKQLVARADIVIENYSSGVLPKLGLDYGSLKQINPEIIMVSMPAFAADGPLSECRAYGSTLEQASGLPTVSGSAQSPPAMNHIAYGDPIGGLNAVSTLLVALDHRRRTGLGQVINLSQVECMLPMVAPWVIEQSANQRVQPRAGSKHQAFSPHGYFKCSGGDDEWLMVSVTTQEQWLSLCEEVLPSEIQTEFSRMDLSQRRIHESQIEQYVQAWTVNRTPDEAMTILQSKKIPAGVVRAPFDLLKDPHLCAREYWSWIEHPFIGSHPQPAAAYRENGVRYPVRSHPPTLGQHNEQVLLGLLNFSQLEFDRLLAAGIIGTAALPPHLRKARAAVGAN